MAENKKNIKQTKDKKIDLSKSTARKKTIPQKNTANKSKDTAKDTVSGLDQKTVIKKIMNDVKSAPAKKTRSKPPTKSKKSTGVKRIALALQGGGAHGAFAWGIIDRILEDSRLEIASVSGTSAGGMNAACLTQGLVQGGNKGARELLESYWRKISELGQSSPFKTTIFDDLMDYHNLDHSPLYHMINTITHYFSPYQVNPLNVNPLKDFIHDFFDFDLLKKHTDQRIFLGATHVKTGKIKVFTNEDMSPEVLLASACLPFMFHAVQVKGEHYWDGGFIANPAVYPLLETKDCKDIVMVQLTRSHCDEIPTTAPAIIDRLKEITYNGCLVREMRAIYFITKLIDEGRIEAGTLKRVNMHIIKNEAAFKDLKLNSALNTDWGFLMKLKDAGRKTADHWIRERFDRIGSDRTQIDEELFADFMS